MKFFDQWEEVPDNITYDNGFKIQWEDFIRHVVARTRRGSTIWSRAPRACSSPSSA